MLTLARLSIALAVAHILSLTAAQHGADAMVRVTAYARGPGEYATWQMCLLKPGMVARFQSNPSRSTNDALGVSAERTVLTIHVAPTVKPGAYPLILLSYSYLDGPRGYPLIRGFKPTLRVLRNHQVLLPAFNRWRWIPAPDPEDYVPDGPCTSLPAITTSVSRERVMPESTPSRPRESLF